MACPVDRSGAFGREAAEGTVTGKDEGEAICSLAFLFQLPAIHLLRLVFEAKDVVASPMSLPTAYQSAARARRSASSSVSEWLYTFSVPPKSRMRATPEINDGRAN